MSRIPEASWAYVAAGTTLEALSDALDLAGVAPDGLSEEAGTATAWFSGGRPQGDMPVPGTWTLVPRTDWSEAWKEGLEPVVVGAVTIAPPWHAPEGPRLEGPPWLLVVEPGLAFGTGHHETTMTCLAVLQELDLVGRRVVDVGTGTGVLALAVLAMGASEVIGVDTDPEAVDVAQANIAAHGVAGRIEVRQGSCEAAGGPGDVVVANIITDKLLALAEDLVALVRPGGTLVCCGIARERTEEAVEAFAAAGIEVTARPGVEWTALIGTRLG